MATAPTIPIFNPMVKSKACIETFLREYSTQDKTAQLIHPYSLKEQCVYDTTNKQIRWEKVSINADSLLAENTDAASIEDRVKSRINAPDALRILNLTNKTIIVQPIPDGQETLECSVDQQNKSRPLIFIISSNDDGFFDLVINSCNSDTNTLPLFFNHHLNNGLFSFKHSDDNYSKRGRQKDLIQYMAIDEETSNNDGYISTQAYEKKSFLQIKNSDPNICIVDYLDNNMVRIYVKLFPLSKDIVKKSGLCHLAKFSYRPSEGKVIWNIPKQPVFDKEIFHVGEPFEFYRNGILTLKQNIDINMEYDNVETIRKTIATITTKEDEDDDDDDDNDNSVLIIQKPLLKNDTCNKLLEKFLNNSNVNIYTFHTNIGTIDDDDDEEDSNIANNHNFTLPIAGGSVVYDTSITKIGRPITHRRTAIKFQKDLNKNIRPIIILSDMTQAINLPKIKSKLNAVYIIINMEIKNTNPIGIEEKINNINASMTLTMQGCLSTVFVYLPSTDQFYYYRGIINRKKTSFASNVSLDDILSEASIYVPFLKTPAQSSIWPIYNYTSRIFDININDTTAINTINNILDNLRNKHLETEDEIVLYLKYIIAQLEVIVDTTLLDNMIEIITEKVNNSNQISRRDCLNLIISNRNQIDKCPSKHRINVYISVNQTNLDNAYTNQWLMEAMAEILVIDSKSTLVNNYTEMFKNIKHFIRQFSSSTNYEILLFDVLNTCVSFRSCYGIRKRGLNQIIRQKTVNKNLETIHSQTDQQVEELLENNCDEVILLKINQNEILRYLTNNNPQEKDIKSLTNIKFDFYNVKPEIIQFLLKDHSSLDGQYGIYSTQDTFLVIPILKQLLDVMKDPQNHNWRQVNENGVVERVRMMLRQSIFDMIPARIKNSFDIRNPGSVLVSNILINVLISGIYSMANDKNDFSQSHVNDGIIQRFRGFMGYILSIMASGVMTPASLVYDTILYKHKVSNNKISLNSNHEYLWLHQILKIWSYLKIDPKTVNVRTNAVECIFNRMKDIVQPFLHDENDIKKLREIQHLKRAEWTYNFLRPVVLSILRRKFPEILQEEKKIEKECVSRENVRYEPPMKRTRKQPTIFSSHFDDDDKVILKFNTKEKRDIDSDIQNMLDQQSLVTLNSSSSSSKFNKKQKRKSITKIGSRSRTKIPGFHYYNKGEQDYTSFISQMKEILAEYTNLRQNYPQSLNAKSFLFQKLDKLEDIIDDPKEKKGVISLTNHIYSAALDIYLHKSSIFLQLAQQLNNYLHLTNPIIENIKYSILVKALTFKTPLYTYTSVPQIIQSLIKCQSIDDYKDKKFSEEVKMYVLNKLKEGHFMKGVLSQEGVSGLMDEAERLKNKQIEKLQSEIHNNVNLDRMFNFIVNKNAIESDVILQKLVDI